MAENQNDDKKNADGGTGSGTPGTYSANPQASVGDQANDAAKRAQGAVDESVQRGREYYERAAERGREALHDAKEHGREYIEEGRRRGERYYDTAREQAGSYYDEARERAGHYYDEASDWARHGYDYASDWTHDRYDDALYYGREGYRSTTRFAQENPLLVGVVALAAGIFVGAMLPRTSREDRNIGPYADDLRRRGARYARDYSRHAFSDDDSHPVHESEWRKRRDEAAEAMDRMSPDRRR
jgi:vacuolar-type H+-ATPase subunit H